ncbi:MAG: diguanylate cyclase [Pseudomonadota bacterium]|nr:diguanylate cyclase [Pseudomonadota bacterium]
MTALSPTIVYLSETDSEQRPDDWRFVESPSGLLSEGTAPIDVIVIDNQPKKRSAWIRQLRMDNRYRLSLLLTTKERGDPLTDGVIRLDTDAVLLKWRLWQERLAMFNRGILPERFDDRVLAWLWSRPRQRIEPEKVPGSRTIYRYPLINVMASDEPVNDFIWLRLMHEQGWLEPGELMDRIRLCRQCNSARLNYVDVCPQCNALDIARQPALHCFTCGHVAPQEHFLKDGVMICPNCLTRLRHIGSDYDRPLENYRCQSCQSFFVDADVEARCLDCEEHHQPEDLKVREIRPYSLTESGRLRCRQGLGDADTGDWFGRLNLIPPEAFRGLLDWQIQQTRRYSNTPHGSLMLLRFTRLRESLSDARAMTLVDGLIERIQEAIRETDRCTRTHEEQLWLLLPSTDQIGMRQLQQRLSSLIQGFHEQDDVNFDIRVAGFTFPTDLLSQEDASLFMARLSGAVSG